MYLADLSRYVDPTGEPVLNMLNVGWLDQSERFSRGNSEPLLSQRLEKLFEVARVNVMRGFYSCTLCNSSNWPPRTTNERPSIKIRGLKVFLGNCELWFPDKDGTVFVTPSLIIHYISAHDYDPPISFVRAVMNEYVTAGWSAESELARIVRQKHNKVS